MAAWMYLFRVFLRRFVGEEALFHAFYSFLCDGRAWLGDWSGGVGGVTGTKPGASPRLGRAFW